MREKLSMKKPNSKKTFDQGCDEYILYCKSRNLRPATIKHNEDCINIFYKFISPKTFISDITPSTVDAFKLFLRNEMKENDVSMNTNIRGLRALLYYFMRLGYMQEFKVQEIKVDKDIIETYTQEELKLLLKKPDLKKCSFLEYRNWVIVNFLMATGCRASTLVNIKIKDLDFENELITYKVTKNRKQQIVPMSNTLKHILIEYLQYRNGKVEDYLFVNAYGDFLTTDQLSHNISSYNKKSGVINKCGVHRFRHTFSKLWIMNNGDIFRLQKLLGHSTMDMVKNYVSIFTNDLQKDFNSFNPLEQMKDNKKFIRMEK